MSKIYIEPGRAALTGATVSRKGAVSYGEFYSDRIPDVNDDLTEGYAEGSVWHHEDRRRVYICVDPTAGAAVWRDLGEAYKITVTCRNNTGSTISKGRMVYVTGALGDHPTIALADKDSENTSSRTLGMVVSNIANNADGQVAVNGTVDKLNTNGYAAGTPLWLGDNGQWTDTKPVPPAHSVFVGWVTRSNANNGRVILHVQNGYELDELHDVLLDDPPANGDVLTYNSTSGLWENAAPSGGGGIEVLSISTTDTTVTNATTDTHSYTIGAGKLNTNGDTIRATWAGQMDFSGADTLSIFLRFSDASLGGFAFDSTILGDWEMIATITRTSSTAAKVRLVMTYGANGSEVGYFNRTTGIDWTGTETVALRIQSNGATASATTRMSTVEFLPSP